MTAADSIPMYSTGQRAQVMATAKGPRIFTVAVGPSAITHKDSTGACPTMTSNNAYTTRHYHMCIL